MRRRQIVALCLVVGSLIAAAITPGVVARQLAKPTPPQVKPGFTVDTRVYDPSTRSWSATAHKFREIKPGEPGYVPEPKPGHKGHEEPGR